MSSTTKAALLLAGVAVLHGTPAMTETLGGQHRNELRAALEAQPRPAGGARLFEPCAVCHARDAGGSTNGIVPALAGQQFRYLVKQIAEFREHERFAGDIHDRVAREAIDGPQAIADLSAYLAELPPIPRPKTGPGRRVSRGGQLYRAACESCHGESALGNDASGTPNLRGQHYAYLVRQMGDIGRVHRVNTPIELILLMKDMSAQDAEAVADYLSRLQASAPP